MATASERIPVLVSPAEKAQIAEMARLAGVSMGEYLRRAAAAFNPGAEDDKMLAGMIEQIYKTTAQANTAMDEALAFVEQSNARIAQMERGH